MLRARPVVCKCHSKQQLLRWHIWMLLCAPPPPRLPASLQHIEPLTACVREGGACLRLTLLRLMLRLMLRSGVDGA